MSFGYATEKNVSSKTDTSVVDWVRPSDWLPLTPVGSTEQKLIGLYAIFSDDRRNRVAILCNGATTIDWGDGVVENVNNATQASHQYTYADIPIGTLTTEGFKQVIITVTPQAGQNLTTVNIRQRPNNIVVGGFATNWLDIEVGSPNLTTLTIGANNSTASFGLLKRLRFVSKAPAYTSFTDFLYLLYALEECIIDANMSNALNLSAFFYTCLSLKKAPFFDTSSCTNTAYMFGLCRSLVSVPNYNFQNVLNISNMFEGCSLLERIGFNNLNSVTSMASAFINCSSLVEVPTINCANNTTLATTFSGCNSLQTVKLTNTDKVTTFLSAFANCNSLTSATINMVSGNATTTSLMFNNCYVLEEAPFFDTSKVTNASSMFLGARNLEVVPEYNMANCTNMSQMFSSCGILQDVPVFNTSNVTNFSSMFADCTELIEAPNLDTIKATTVASMYTGCRSLVSIPAHNLSNNTTGGSTILGAPSGFGTINLVNIDTFGSRFGINIGQGFLDETELTDFMTNMGIAGAAGQTLTITGNYGAGTIITRSCPLTTNQNSISSTGIQAAGVTVGMFVTGTSITSALSVSVNASTDRISSAVISFPDACIGSRVSFTTTANGITAYQTYYVVAVEFAMIKVSLTPGGAPINITSDGTMTMNFENTVRTVSADSVTVAFPASATGTQSLSFRSLNTNIARLKNYTVTG